MKLSSFQWIRHCVTKNNADVQQNFVQPASARAGRPGKKPLRRAGEEGTTNPTSNLNPQLALLCAHQWVEMLFPNVILPLLRDPVCQIHDHYVSRKNALVFPYSSYVRVPPHIAS